MTHPNRMDRRRFLTISASVGLFPLAAGAADKEQPGLGVGASLHGKRLFPADNPWNQDISREPVDPNSAALIRSIGLDRPLHPDFGSPYGDVLPGMPYVVVSGNQRRVPVEFDYKDESDPGPYPIPLDAPIEGGPGSKGDRHVLVIDRDRWRLYELFAAYPGRAAWKAGSGAVFDLNSNKLRPAGWTSADAAGLPVFPGLVRYDEVGEQKEVRHALRFTTNRTRRGYVFPARHFASQLTSPNLPPMGMRVRLRADFNTSGFPAEVRVILKALKKYGMILADNGSPWFVSGTLDSRWDNDALHHMTRVRGKDFEVVRMGRVVTR